MAAAQTTDLIIKDFQVGIGPSPYLGFGDMRNLDVYTLPGIARLNYSTAKQSGSVMLDTPHWIEADPNNPTHLYSVDGSGNAYTSSDQGGTWTKIPGITVTISIASPAVVSHTAYNLDVDTPIVFSTTGALPTGIVAGQVYYIITAGAGANSFEFSATLGGSAINTSGSQSGTHTLMPADGKGNGMKIFGRYLIVARPGWLDTYGPLNSSPGWMFQWQPVAINNFTGFIDWHCMLLSKNDGKLYIGEGAGVASLEAAGGDIYSFDPATGGTFTYTAIALDLPIDVAVKAIGEQGNNVMLGTWKGEQVKWAVVYPWNRSDESFGQPFGLDEIGINQMWVDNEIIYCQAGYSGKYFRSNGVQFNQIAQIPNAIANLDSGQRIDCLPGAVAWHRGRLFFGTSLYAGSNLSGMGVWSINPGNKYSLIYENLISTGDDGSSTNVVIGALFSAFNRIFHIGWRDGSSYGIDRVNTDRYTTYLGYVESPFYRVGTSLGPRQFTQMEFQLTAPLATGQGLKFYYRNNVLASYTQITTILPGGVSGTFDFATLGAISSLNFNPGIPSSDFLQIKAVLTTASGSTLSPELEVITLR